MVRELEREFDYHPADTQRKRDRHAAARDAVDVCFKRLEAELMPGRELSLVKTKLQEALMWANAGIAYGQDPHPDQ